MALNVMTVCDANGDISSKGTIQPMQVQIPNSNPVKYYSSPYQFYAKAPGLEGKPSSVNIVLPIGGDLSGMYRFPRVGEKVLVDQADDKNYYLMGYVPSEEAGISSITGSDSEKLKTTYTDEEIAGLKAKAALGVKLGNDGLAKLANYNKLAEYNKLLEGNGLVIRRKSGGPYVTGYSEIGIYNAATDWVASIPAAVVKAAGIELQDGQSLIFKGDSGPEKSYHFFIKFEDGTTTLCTDEAQSTVLSNWLDANCDWAGYPKIDLMNFQSAGDMHSTAQNHNLVTGKRVEILAGFDNLPDHRPEAFLPLDKAGDDNPLKAGQVHIRAKKKIVLKAAEEIQLQVGRTTVSITDKGFKVITQRIKSNWPSTWDTSLSLSPLSGISMEGEDIKLNATRITELKDSFGGGINSRLGITQVTGRNISLITPTSTTYNLDAGINDFLTVANTVLLSLAKESVGTGPRGQKAQDIVNVIYTAVKKVLKLWSTNRRLHTVKNALDVICSK